MDRQSVPGDYRHGNVTPEDVIFVVDDDENVRDILPAILAPQGFPVVTFEDGESFLSATSTRVPICVFLDVVMPKRSGLEILKELRARQYWTPTFLISARNDIQTVVEAMKNGAHDYIRKPFDRVAPTLRVREAVELWSYQRQRRSTLDVQLSENGEWFRLTPNERDVLALMRSMEDVRSEVVN